MDNKSRKKATRRLRYFFINGELHKKLHVNRSTDLITSWNYAQGKRLGYSWSDTKRNLQNAYTVKETAALLNRHRNRILEYIERGHIEKPQNTYTPLVGDEYKDQRRIFKYMFSEDDVMAIRDFLSTLHRGRPRKDGLVTAKNVPTRQELRAIMKNEVVLYQKTEDGDFMPVWKQPEW
jgi:hypothetical protein